MEQFYTTLRKNKIDLKHYIYKIGSYHYNWHRELEIMVLLTGEIEVAAGGDKKILLPGDVILINSNQSHATLAHRPDSIAMVLHVDPKFFTDYFENVDYLFFECCSAGLDKDLPAFRFLRSSLARMILQMERTTPEQKLRYESEFHSLIHAVVKNFPPREIQLSTYQSNKNRQDVINSLIKFIDRNYTKKITLEDLAGLTNYNPSYLSQLFKSHLGINFYDYLTRIRLREATYELGSTDHTVSAVALAHGFSDVKAFNAAFKTTFGKTPSDYRKKLNVDITRVDMTFKREFVPTDDLEVGQILRDYAGMDDKKPDQGRDPDLIKSAAEALQTMSRLSRQLDEASMQLKFAKVHLSASLPEVADSLLTGEDISED